MVFLQKRFRYQAKFKPPPLKPNKNPVFEFTNQKGFISLFLLPLITLMMTGIIGLASLSVGIKQITQAQSVCIKNNMKGQKELGLLLKKILNLNKKVLKLHKTRQALQKQLALAVGTGQIQLIPFLKKALSFVRKGQALLILKQKYILEQSRFVKIKTFKKIKKEFKSLPTSKLQEKSFFKKALALEKKKAGDSAYTYKPVPNFTEQQKSQFTWKMNPFYPLDTNWLNFKKKKLFQYQCTASLTKKGKVWISHLYH